MPDLNVYAKRQAEWLPVVFESDTEIALDRIFTRFETDLFIPCADPIRYLIGSTKYYQADDESGNHQQQFLPHNAIKGHIKYKGMKRQELSRNLNRQRALPQIMPLVRGSPH